MVNVLYIWEGRDSALHVQPQYTHLFLLKTTSIVTRRQMGRMTAMGMKIIA